MTRVDQLRIVGIAEGVSYLVLLFIAMPVKYLLGYPLAVTIAGSLHGVLFILYVVAMICAIPEQKWAAKEIVEVFLAALYPCGTFILDRKLRARKQKNCSV